ncbi:MAG TPA: hypothetical protein VN713_07160 [Sphingomicrobium sp.]|nr:hypothetical protein [Sphingomicrobium sp.]
MAHGYIEDGYGIDGGIDRERGDDRDRRWRNRDRGTMFSDRDREDRAFREHSARRGYSANPDDHYLRWRDRHMSELDRDYADYCREREQQFHSDFDAWRSQRHANYQPLRTGMTNSGLSHDPSGQVQVETEGEPAEFSATGAATLGTNDPPEPATGRGRR